ncbi:MAG TPA: hypothetical protein VGR93_14065 [Candidatus Acidoferrales bacterium]|nr:hypothetical protein [Candidatus Acidoferrales bacterium]
MSGRQALVVREDEIEAPISEQKLWVAVLAQALEDLQGDRLTARHEAEHFLLRDRNDFFTVCAAAGIDPSSFRSRLGRLHAASIPQAPQLAA